MKKNLVLVAVLFALLPISIEFAGIHTLVNAQNDDDKIVTLAASPNEIYVNRFGVLIDPSTTDNDGINTKGLIGEIVTNGGDLSVHYYRYMGTKNGEDQFELESRLPPKEVSPDNMWVDIEFPIGWQYPDKYLIGKDTKLYKIYFVENDAPVAQMMFQIHYPEIHCSDSTKKCD